MRLFMPFAAGYFLSYVYRTINAVLAPEIAHAAGVDASGLGLLTSSFFLAFAAAQLPLGMLLDRFGPRRVESSLLAVGAVGVVVFGNGHTLTELTLGRALMGLGASACMMAAFKAFVQWFDVERLPLANGYLLGCGAIGALAATMPVQAALDITSWRMIFIGLAVATVSIALSLLLFVPDHHETPKHSDMKSQMRGVKTVFRDAFFWRITPLAAVSQGTLLSVQGLWAGPWLRDVAHQSPSAVASHLGALAISVILGFFVTGTVAQHLMRRGIPQTVVIGVGMTLFALVMAALAAGVSQLPLLMWIIFGFSGSASILAYSALSSVFPRHLSGRANTALNLVAFIAAFAIQWGMGAVIDLWRNPTGQTYGVQGYQAAFTVLALLQVAALIWFALPRHRRSERSYG